MPNQPFPSPPNPPVPPPAAPAPMPQIPLSVPATPTSSTPQPQMLQPSHLPFSNPSVPPTSPNPPPPTIPVAPTVTSEDADLARLSPFEVLRKRHAADLENADPVPAVTPPPPPPVPVQPSREELLRQAAEAPVTSFVLPDDSTFSKITEAKDIGEAPDPELEPAVVPPIIPVPPKAPPIVPPPPPPLPIPSSPIPVPPPPPTTIASSRPSMPPPPPPPGVPATTPPPAPAVSAKPTPPVYQKRKKGPNIVLISVVTVVLLLILAAGGGYGLAYTGTQIPVVYTMVSGLKTSGINVAAQAATAVTSAASYDLSGQIAISIKGSSSTPGLPSSSLPNASASTVTPISSLSDQEIMGHVAAGSWTAQENMAVNGQTTPVPVSIKALSSGSSWLTYTAGNSTAQLQYIDPTALEQTALYPNMILPLPSEIVSSVKSASSYQKLVVGKTSVASYLYQLDPTKMRALVPTGATVSSATSTIAYAWKTAYPVTQTVSLTYSYENETYTYQSTFAFSNWNGTSTLTGKDITALNGTATGAAVDPLTFVADLGITAASLPNTLGSTAPVSTAITPSGATISAVTSPITAIPPVPATVASDQAKTRDAQRLQDLTDLQTALAAYKATNGSYPVVSSMDQTVSSQTLFSALVPTYLTAMPVDPLSTTYWYEYTSDGSTYLLRSVAEDSSNSQALKGAAYSYFQRTNP